MSKRSGKNDTKENVLYESEETEAPSTSGSARIHSVKLLEQDDIKRENSYWSFNNVNFESAMEFAEIGMFQTLILVPCLLAFSTTSMAPNIYNKFRDAIQCDLQLIEKDKIVINDIVYTCMIIGGTGWSLIADTLSLKWSLIFALSANVISALGISASGTFLTFGFFRGIGAFCLSGITVMTVVYLSELQSRSNRGSMICCLQLAWILGIITIPELPLSWMARISATSLPCIGAILSLVYFPESPRFLMSRDMAVDALKSISFIHSFNTKKSIWKFPKINLVENDTAEDIKHKSKVKQYIPHDLRIEFVCYIVLVLSHFILMFSYSTMAQFYPDLIVRDESFLTVKPNYIKKIPNCRIGFGDRYIDLISSTNKSTNKRAAVDETTTKENPCARTYVKSDEYYSNIRSTIALCCLPSILLLIYAVDSIGRKIFATLSHIFLGILIFSSYFLHTRYQSLIFACLFEALALMSISSSHCLAVELFPSRIRVFGTSLVLGAGHLGIVAGNLNFAVKVFPNCVWLVTSISYLLTISGFLIMLLPNTTGCALK